jgi:hypothetical protein
VRASREEQRRHRETLSPAEVQWTFGGTWAGAPQGSGCHWLPNAVVEPGNFFSIFENICNQKRTKRSTFPLRRFLGYIKKKFRNFFQKNSPKNRVPPFFLVAGLFLGTPLFFVKPTRARKKTLLFPFFLYFFSKNFVKKRSKIPRYSGGFEKILVVEVTETRKKVFFCLSRKKTKKKWLHPRVP